MTVVHIGLGGNRCRPPKQIAAALYQLAKIPGAKLRAASKLYISAAQGCPGRQANYANAVAEMQTILPPRRLFNRLQKIQRAAAGRRRCRCAPRILDVDYLLHGAAVCRSPKLTLPHPRMQTRAFVLRPLADLRGKNYQGLKNANALRRAMQNCRQQFITPLKNNSPPPRIKNNSPSPQIKKSSSPGRIKKDSSSEQIKNNLSYERIKNNSSSGRIKNNSSFLQRQESIPAPPPSRRTDSPSPRRTDSLTLRRLRGGVEICASKFPGGGNSDNGKNVAQSTVNSAAQSTVIPLIAGISSDESSTQNESSFLRRRESVESISATPQKSPGDFYPPPQAAGGEKNESPGDGERINNGKNVAQSAVNPAAQSTVNPAAQSAIVPAQAETSPEKK